MGPPINEYSLMASGILRMAIYQPAFDIWLMAINAAAQIETIKKK